MVLEDIIKIIQEMAAYTTHVQDGGLELIGNTAYLKGIADGKIIFARNLMDKINSKQKEDK